MRRAASLFTAVVVVAVPFQLLAAPRTFVVEPTPKTVGAKFTSRAPLESIEGRTRDVRGKIAVDPRNLSTARAEITVDLRTLDTGIDTRNAEMRGEKYLDVRKHPAARFTLSKVQGARQLRIGRPTKLRVTGTLMLHGVEKRITVPAEITYLPETEETRKVMESAGDHLHLVSTFRIKMSDYGIPVPRMMLLQLEDALELTVDVVAREAPERQDSPTPVSTQGG